VKRVSHLRGQAGLSLIELLVVSVILVALNGLVYTAFRYESLTYNRETARGVAESDLRTWMARMVKDIRNAGYDPRATAGAGITFATSTDFEFKVDFDKSGAINASDGKETLGYRLSGTSLQLRQGSTWRTVVRGVTSTSLFTYWNFQGGQVNQTSPYTSYQDIAEVRITITAQGANASSSITESGRALIRNPNSL
jgi:prepilin-type N-terminal cleavage/methylation domain-containing protein